MKEIEAFVEEITEERDHWMLACRTGNFWTMSILQPTREAAINDLPNWSHYDEYRLIKVTLPVMVLKKEPEEDKELTPNPLISMLEI